MYEMNVAANVLFFFSITRFSIKMGFIIVVATKPKKKNSIILKFHAAFDFNIENVCECLVRLATGSDVWLGELGVGVSWLRQILWNCFNSIRFEQIYQIQHTISNNFYWWNIVGFPWYRKLNFFQNLKIYVPIQLHRICFSKQNQPFFILSICR